MSAPAELLDLVDSLDAIVFEADARTFRFTFVNRRAESLLGYPVEQWLDEPDFWARHIHPEDRDAAVTICRTATAAGEDHVLEYRFLAADGRVVWQRDVVRVIPDALGQPAKLRGVMVDITARKVIEEALVQSEARSHQSERNFRALIENGNDLVSIIDGSGVVRYASPPHERVLGWKPAELEGRNAFDLVHPDDLPGLAEVFAQGIAIPGFTATHEFRYRTGDGQWRILEGRAMSLLHDPAVNGAVINLRDVTERRRAEEHLRHRLEFEQVIADVSTTLSNAGHGELDTALRHVLAIVSATIGAERAIIALFSHGHFTWHARHEWHAPDHDPIAPALQNVPRHQFDWMLSRLQEDGWSEVTSVDDLPAAAPERAAMEELGVGAGRAVRITARGRFLGFVLWTYGATAAPRPLEEDLQLLRLVGDICANAIARQQEEDTRAALLDLSRQLGGSLVLSELLERVQPSVATLMGCDMVSTYLVDEPGEAFELVSSHGLPEEFRNRAAASIRAGYPIHDLLLSGQVAVGNDIGAQTWFRPEEISPFDVDHFLLAPLLLHGDLRGFIGVARRHGARSFDTAEVELLDGIARHVSLAVQSADLFRNQQVEATVGSALARAGREVISSLDQPVLLDRLSRLTADLLGCEFAHTYLWNAREEVFAVVATHGESPEVAEALRVLRFPASLVGEIHEQLRWKGVVRLESPRDERERTLSEITGIQSIVYIALRRGEDLVGALAAGWRSRAERFSSEQIRIAHGLGQLGSLALANARVLEELDQISRLRSDFVATMSHELRTPLNVILGYSDLLRDGAFSPLLAEQRDIVDRVQHSARELLELINATLDVSRIDSGRLPVERSAVDLGQLAATVRAEMTELEPPSGVRLEWDLTSPLPVLATDPVKLKVILKNLIGNALKFTDQGEVRVTARPHRGGVEISVTDTGIGIPPEAQAVIFEAFRQADSSTTRPYGGVGLGLYIVQRLLDLLAGRITLESEVGTGSTFRIWLPAVAEDSENERNSVER
jgi:PAS domain S-box-containing protein